MGITAFFNDTQPAEGDLFEGTGLRDSEGSKSVEWAGVGDPGEGWCCGPR